MDVRLCSDCVAAGVDCPLVLDGECTRCGRRIAPISRRIADYEYRLRFAWDSLCWRIGVPAARLRARSSVARLVALLR